MAKDSLSSKLSDKKAALYIRVSTLYQIDKDSLPLQRSDLINYCKYALDIDKYEVFEDAGYSAKNTDRPAFQQMMARLRSGEFSHLLVWKIDRISRNLLDFSEMYVELKKLGVTFVSKNEQFDTSSAMGEAMLKIILVFAELERNMTSERVKAVMISKAKDGQWNGGKVPFGYDWDKESKSFSINENEAMAVNQIYDLYEKEQSLLLVSRTLNERGFLTRRGRAWSPTTVSSILNNKFYAGTYIYNKYGVDPDTGNVSRQIIKDESEWVVVEDHHPAIVGAERQARVSAILERNRRSNHRDGKKYVRKNTHIFAGLLYCAYCGGQMQATIDRARNDGYRPSIYACSRKRRFNDCGNKYISDVVIGPFVLNYIANILKAQKSFGKTTSVDAFEKKLLRGAMFFDVLHIDTFGLTEMYDMLREENSGEAVYSAVKRSKRNKQKEESNERDLLLAEKHRNERALQRLKSLFLYSDETISESDYLVEKKNLTDAMDKIDKRIKEIDKSSVEQFSLSDDEFMEKASTFIMTNALQGKRYIDFEEMIKTIDTKVVKNFVVSIIQKIVIKDGRILSICFKNGIEHKFLYKT